MIILPLSADEPTDPSGSDELSDIVLTHLDADPPVLGMMDMENRKTSRMIYTEKIYHE